MKRKAYVVILDAVIALLFFLFIATAFIMVYEPAVNQGSVSSFKNIHYVSEDSLDVLNKKGVLDDIGTLWAAANGSENSTHWSDAGNMTREYLDAIIPARFGYRLIIDETNVIYDSDLDNDSERPKESDAETKTYSSRLLVGYGQGMPTRGHVARAFLTNIQEKVTSTYAYFGGFEGQGVITKKVTLPSVVDSVKEICLEYDSGDDFTLWIDGTSVPQTFSKSPGNMVAEYQCVNNPGNFIPAGSGGDHTFEIDFWSTELKYQYIGGGFIKVTYNTTEFDTAKETGVSYYDIPGIEGLINLYSAFYVPGIVNSFDTYLRFDNNYSTYMTVGDAIVFDTEENTSRAFCNISDDEYECVIPSTNMSDILSAAGISYAPDLSEQTVPFKIAAKNVSSNESVGLADVILITDLSGSMNWRVGDANETAGVQRDCLDPDINLSDTKRISLAKCIDMEFIDYILNATGNRVGLVGFMTSANEYYPLSDNKADLLNAIDDYPDNPANGTCICCAINRALQLFGDPFTPIPVNVNPEVESPHPYPHNLNPPSSGTWTINAPAAATSMRIHFRRLETQERRVWHGNWYADYLWVTDGNSQVVQLPGWEGNEVPNAIDTDDEIWNYWTGWGNGSFMTVNLESDSRFRGRGFEVDRYEYVIGGNVSENGRYIIVMTDGITGQRCGLSGACAYPGCSGTCTSTSGSYSCGGNSGDCTETDCNDAIDDAICTACRAHNEYGVTVYSVGFGPVNECTNGNYTLHEIASCGNGSYYGSSDPEELRDIYKGIASHIVNVTYDSQSASVTGNLSTNTLYSESYLRFQYTPTQNLSAYGEITLTQNTERFNESTNCTGSLIAPSIATITDARVTSYSSEYWTDYLQVNGAEVYSLRDMHFGDIYLKIGDPYLIQISPLLLASGYNNTLLLGTGDNPYPPYAGCSQDNRAIYTIRLSGSVPYGDVFSEKNGCIWTIEFEDATNITEPIPSDYNGTKTCSYMLGNVSYEENDAIDNAVIRLLSLIDSNQNNRTDVKFDSSMIEFDFSRAGGIRSLWGPITMKLVVWD